ncbi:MAG: outer membrane beta-barrel protein [Gammaproteobacteria bacterium]
MRWLVGNLDRQFRLLLVIPAAVILMLQAQLALAQDDDYTYAGVDLNYSNLDALGVTYNPITLRAKLGVVLLPDIVPLFAFETQFGVDIADDTNTINGQPVSLGINYYVGFYARASYEFADVASVYGLLGLSAAQLYGNVILLGDDTETGLSFGLGATFSLPFDIDGSIEVMQLVNGDYFDIYMASIGASYKF